METCKKWYAKGYRTLEDLNEADLTRSQAVGLRYYFVGVPHFLNKVDVDTLIPFRNSDNGFHAKR